MTGTQGFVAHKDGGQNRRSLAHPSPENSSVVLSAGIATDSRNSSDGQGRRVLKDEFARLIGSPKVVIDRDDRRAVVWIADRPWGWLNTTREFLNPRSPGIDRYAEKLLARIRASAEQEQGRKERLKQAKRRECGL